MCIFMILVKIKTKNNIFFTYIAIFGTNNLIFAIAYLYTYKIDNRLRKIYFDVLFQKKQKVLLLTYFQQFYSTEINDKGIFQSKTKILILFFNSMLKIRLNFIFPGQLHQIKIM